MSHHQGRGDHRAHASIARPLGPAMDKSESMINRACVGHTVNGRTLIATLMEEAPSVAAIIVCAGYVFVGMRAIKIFEPTIL